MLATPAGQFKRSDQRPGATSAAQLQLAITPTFAGFPREVLIAAPYLVVILALAVSGRGLAYPGSYLKPYRRT